MACIIDYALLNANRDFSAIPFSEIDGLIFAQLTYLLFDGIVPGLESGAQGVTFAQIVEHKDYDKMFPLERTAERNKKLLNAVAYSKRYGRMSVNYYENILDAEKETQFSAVTFIDENGDGYIAFRGTDATITGWRENFNMLYTSPVASQKLCVPYTESVASKIPGKITLIGHSKGGNLAIYAGAVCKKKAKEKIVSILSYDNPGFTEEFINSKKYIEAESKITKIVPEQSMIGMLLNNRGSYRVVKSDGDGFYQHDPFMWWIDGNDFVNGDRVVTKAQIIDNTFNEWVFSLSPEERAIFVDALFEVVEKTNSQNAATFGQWSENIKGNTSSVFDAIKELDPETRSIMKKAFINLFSSARESVTATPKAIIKTRIKRIPLLLSSNEENKS